MPPPGTSRQEKGGSAHDAGGRLLAFFWGGKTPFFFFFLPRKHHCNYVKPYEWGWLPPSQEDTRHNPLRLIHKHPGGPFCPNKGIPLSHRGKGNSSG